MKDEFTLCEPQGFFGDDLDALEGTGPIYSEKCLGPVQPLWGWASVRDGKGQEIGSEMD